MADRIMQKEIISDPFSPVFANYEITDTLQEFLALQQIYEAGIKEVKTKLEILDDEFKIKHDHNPIHHMEYRLKSVRSILGKLEKRGLEVSLESIVINLTDIAGVRVICNYVSDVYKIADMLIKQSDIKLIKKKDYIKHPKNNGYRSLHLVVEVPIFLAEKVQPIPVEIQIRTIAMDFWASLEHHLRYKADNEVPDGVRDELIECAKTISNLDYKMQGIYEELSKSKKKNLVP
ncbi:GTP pyrophosphokinase [Thomasclavelia cocleata]|uniref:Putative GTP pyrophosphokinase n=2 Tax=Thomasclavelia cocleata TaxID=69824 RepID=A0A1I0H796_9FIRM|nr:GTP pyrophosphokinase family protein [Thomasclavelia cocleata]MCR1961030.1 GTP pyrophosphokinase family protein [Thomasclavelia cocleata]NDO41177.1 GTP pyrophosphokinase family protein [Thomasclavelia cocleata]PJN80836.1 GTP pyrophosphokinase [Thomasclavelia cocleata]SET78704.1 putative GTP pyrophosphokinase [Thomasclavelia cocleata]